MKLPSLLLAICLAAQPLVAAEPRSPRILLQEALFAEEAERDLEKASAGYAELLEQFATQRTLAATALYHLAEIRAQQKKTAEAIALHQRLLAEFPKEETLVKRSRDRLAALGGTAPSIAAGAADAVSAKEAEELARLRDLVKNSPDLLDAQDAKNGDTPLVTAATNGWLQAATFLLDQHRAINGQPGSWVPLHWAAHHGRRRMVELLLERGADVNAASKDGWTALQAAVHHNYLAVAGVLLAKGAKAEAQVLPDYRNVYSAAEDGPPLVVAVKKGAMEMARLLLDKGADPNFASLDKEVSPLGAAAEAGSLEMVKLLLEHHAKLDQPQKGGFTPLILATRKKHVEIVQLLLKSGAKVELADETGATALHYAAGTSEPLVERLLAAGASPKAVTKAGLTPLHFTMAGQSSATARDMSIDGEKQRLPFASIPKVWEELVAKGGDLNAADDSGLTLLHYACGVPDLPLKDLEFLIQKGANPDVKTKLGASPFEFSPDREKVEQALLFPKLAKLHAVTVLNRVVGLDPQTYAPAKPGEETPAWATVLQKASAGQSIFPSWKVTLYRADAEGRVKEAGSHEGQMSSLDAKDLPKLQWGDVVVLAPGSNAAQFPQTGVINPDPRRRLRVLSTQ